MQERIRLFGGAAQVIEDPPEMAIQSTLDNGLIQQISVNSAPPHVPELDRLAWHTRNAVRSSTDILFLGEVRDPAEASAVVMQSGIGGPVITTIHADTIETSIARLIALASRDMGSAGAASQVAAHLAAVLHLTLSARPVEVSARRGAATAAPLLVLTCRLLLVERRDAALRSAIERQDMAMLSGTIGRQNDQRVNGPGVARYRRPGGAGDFPGRVRPGLIARGTSFPPPVNVSHRTLSGLSLTLCVRWDTSCHHDSF